MSRIPNEVQRHTKLNTPPDGLSATGIRLERIPRRKSTFSNLDFWLMRLCLLAGACALGATLAPFGLKGMAGAAVGFSMALVILLAELRLRRAAIGGLVGGAAGIVLGLFAALLFTLVVSRTAEPEPTKSFLEYASVFICGYLGLALGFQKAPEIGVEKFSELLTRQSAEPEFRSSLKLLDTSVLIDGRIADICETHFLEGTLVVPQFVLHELQLVADSADGLKRQRGRRGLEVLQRIQKMPHVEIRIAQDDFPLITDVDHKLIEMAKRDGGKIITNDFNLNKVASVQGLTVMNVNQLANSLKPAVLPGETMRVFVLREGKEANQGVAYLDDGTMVVVDGARRSINKNAEIVVTSVHQTPAGKMIFGKLDDRAEPSQAPRRQAAAAQGGRGAGNGRTDPALQVDSGSPAKEHSALDRNSRSIFPEPEPE